MKIASVKPLSDGISEAAASSLWADIEGFASYSFNKSHTIEYALISYQCMWLKVNHPLSFFAAALSLMDVDKLPALLRDAKAMGAKVVTPDINESTHRFEIVGSKLVMPFQALKGISSKSAAAILVARAAGPFTSKADFIARVERRLCNVAHQGVLDKVGAFAQIEPGQPPADDPERVKDQLELLPGLISANVPIHHEMHHDKLTRDAIGSIIDDLRAKHGPGTGSEEGSPVKPHFGRKAKVLIISDAPGAEEDASGVMGVSRSNNAVLEAMAEVGLDLVDVYWTSLVKRPKRGRQITSEEIATYVGYLDREITVLHPSVIVLLGSQAVRHFMPTFKGKASDVAGKIVYFPTLDANVVIGFSSGEIYHDPDKQLAMNEVFASVANLLT